jgi:uncharacterized integral membrane protein
MSYKLITGLIIVCLIVVFIIQNAAIVEIQVFFWTITMSRVLLMVILLFVGVLLGWLLKTYWLFRNYPDED